MFNNINLEKLYEATDRLAHAAYDIGGRYPSASRVWDECMRAFSNKAVISINLNFRMQLLGLGVVDCIATIGRDGSLKMARKAALDELGIEY